MGQISSLSKHLCCESIAASWWYNPLTIAQRMLTMPQYVCDSTVYVIGEESHGIDLHTERHPHTCLASLENLLTLLTNFLLTATAHWIQIKQTTGHVKDSYRLSTLQGPCSTLPVSAIYTKYYIVRTFALDVFLYVSHKHSPWRSKATSLLLEGD